MPRQPPEPPASVWERIIEQFTTMRHYEGPTNIAKVKKLLAVLRDEADVAYRAADAIERDEAPAARPGLRERLDRARLAGDPIAERNSGWIDSLIARQLDFDDPTDLRFYAYFIHKLVVARHEAGLRATEVALVERRHGSRGGRPPSVAMEWLLNEVRQHGITDGMLARRLAAEGLAPDGADETLDPPVERWRAVIHAARRRHRRRPDHK